MFQYCGKPASGAAFTRWRRGPFSAVLVGSDFYLNNDGIDKPAEGTYPFVSHAFAHVQMGQVGILKVGNPKGSVER